MTKRGRPAKIQAAERTILVEIVRADPTATVAEIGTELTRRTGIETQGRTLRNALRDAGIERRTGVSGVRVEVAPVGRPRYGYTEAHRRQAPEQTYPSCLTPTEWVLVEDMFDNDGGRGMPPKYLRRLLVDACC